MSAYVPECQKSGISSAHLDPQEIKEKIFAPDTPQKLILLAGPTACGKSQLALMLAELVGGEIISADSMQVYRGMDIGTAKASLEERERIPHHLIDIRSIQESFNVVDFYFEARQAIDSILARGRVPIVVGGSGFYFRVLIYGPPKGPPSVAPVREALEEEMRRVGSPLLYERLRQSDPDYAATISPQDRQKIVRALEIITLTGGRVTNHQWKQRSPLSDYAYHAWFIYRSRALLYASIDARCDQMLRAGLLEEVQRLEKQGLRTNPSVAQAIGYRQCLDFLDTPQSAQDYDAFVKKFKTASRHYAKRQFTWFRREPLFHWLDIDLHDMEITAEMIAREYQG